LLLAIPLLVLAACGDQQYSAQPATGQPGGGGGGATMPVTGLLLNVQRPPDQIPLKKTLEEWKVADSRGVEIFSHHDVPSVGAAAVVWAWKIADATSWTNKKTKLGENHYEIRMARDEFNEEYTKGVFYVSDVTAAELRDMGNLKQLLQYGKLVLLVGKQGE
jgi:hypothetical protein